MFWLIHQLEWGSTQQPVMLSGAQFTPSQFILYLSAHYRKLKDIELFADSIKSTKLSLVLEKQSLKIVKILFLDKVKTVFWTDLRFVHWIMSKPCYYWILQISSLHSFLAFDDSRECYVCGALPKHQRSDCGAESPWQKIISRFLQRVKSFLHCLVYFVLILHWHQDFRVLKLYQPVYKKIPIRYFGEHPDEFNPKTFNCFQRRCQCDCSFRSPGHLCALSDGREREREKVQYATHFLGSMHMMFFDEWTWLLLQGNCVS